MSQLGTEDERIGIREMAKVTEVAQMFRQPYHVETRAKITAMKLLAGLPHERVTAATARNYPIAPHCTAREAEAVLGMARDYPGSHPPVA